MKSQPILLDIFSYSCMNCLRSLEFIKWIDDKYRRYGLKTMLVHAPEWNFEKNKDNIIYALKKYNINFPIIIDKNKKIIRKFKVNFWPTQILVANEKILHKHVGEGNYRILENKIIKSLKIKTNNIFGSEPLYSSYPTVYCGKRKGGKISKLKIKLKFGVVYTNNTFAQYQDYIKSLKNKSALTIVTKGKAIDFVAESVNKKKIGVTIKLDDKSIRKIRVNKPQLYNLIKLKKSNQKNLTIITPKNLCVYSFSFR